MFLNNVDAGFVEKASNWLRNAHTQFMYLLQFKLRNSVHFTNNKTTNLHKKKTKKQIISPWQRMHLQNVEKPTQQTNILIIVHNIIQ